MGIAVLGNQVIVTCAPNVIVFTDEDGDDKPDKKEYLLTNSGSPQNDHSTHSVLFGPDGKLYWNMGNAGRSVHDKEGKLVVDLAGNPIIDRTYADRLRENPSAERPDHTRGYEDQKTPYQGGMVFRCNLDGEFGNFGYRDELTGGRWPVSRTGRHEEIPKRHWHQNDPGVVPNLLITGAGSPTGITVYEGKLLPKELWNQVLHADAGPGVVRAVLTKKDGAGFTAESVNVLRGERDKWVRPVDVSVAPDGSLFVTDWYDPLISWNRMVDTAKGRVFRIAPKGPEMPWWKFWESSSAARYEVPEFDFDTPEGAVAALKSPNYAVRYLAWSSLNEFQQKAEAALAGRALSRPHSHRRGSDRRLGQAERVPQRPSGSRGRGHDAFHARANARGSRDSFPDPADEKQATRSRHDRIDRLCRNTRAGPNDFRERHLHRLPHRQWRGNQLRS